MAKPDEITKSENSAEAPEHTPRASATNPTTRETLADLQDRRQARLPPEAPAAHKPFWKRLGPGLITGAADDDPSGIGTYSVAGAQFGYGLLWLVPFCIPLMIAVQEMCGRVGMVTGKGLAAVIKEHYPRWLLYGSVGLLIGANVINIYADLNIMAASAKMLFQGSFLFWLTVLTIAIVALQILVPYRRYVRILKWLCLALLAYIVVALMPSVHNDWRQIAHHLFIPAWNRDPAFLLTVVGFLGTTISPYLFFWQAGETVEEEVAEGVAAAPGKRLRQVTEAEIRMVRADTATGMLFSQVITFFIITCTSATLHAHGKTDINTAQDAAEALRPLGGLAAYWLFTLGILGTGMLAIPTLAGSAAYAVAETTGWRYGLYRRFRRAEGFYLTITALIVVGYLMNFVHHIGSLAITPIKGLLYTAVLNGIIAPPLIVILLLVCNNRKIMKERCNGWLSNTLGWLTVGLMGATALFLLWAMATGKAS